MGDGERPQRTRPTCRNEDSLDTRFRAAFIAGAEEDSRRRLGRGLTREELERVLRRYPKDWRRA